MKKLLKLKDWLTVEDAASHIASICEESVTAADVLRLALDGHLILSVYLVNGAYARLCAPVKFDEIEFMEVPSLDGKRTLKMPVKGRIWQEEDGTFYQVLPTVIELDSGVWDLPLKGGERLDIEHRYQVLTSGPEVTTVTLDGIFVAAKSGELFEIQTHFGDNPYFEGELKKPLLHPDNFHPAGALPRDGVFVVRTSVLQDFESFISEEDKAEKPLSTRERNTLLKIIKALCNSQGIDLRQPYKAAEIIKNNVELLGSSISLETIAKKLEQADHSN